MKKALPWFRMYSEAVDDEKLRLLAFEDRWHFVALLCCKAKGVIDEEGDIVRRKIAVKLGLDLRALEEAARRLAEVGLIDEKTLQPLAWDGRQFRSDSSTGRVRAYRERTKRDGNVSETAQETDTDTDTDTEEEKSIGTAPAVLRALPADDEPQRKTSGTPKRATQLPDDFEPDDTAASLAAELGVSLAAELPKFRDYHAARGKPMKDWQAAMRTWLRNAKQFAKPVAKQTESERRAAWLADITGRKGDAIDAPARLVG